MKNLNGSVLRDHPLQVALHIFIRQYQNKEYHSSHSKKISAIKLLPVPHMSTEKIFYKTRI